MSFARKNCQNTEVSTWSLKVNDPTLFAWLCVIAYGLAAFSSSVCAKHRDRGRETSFWKGMAICCGLLAINKQLDAHSALLGIFREPNAVGIEGFVVAILFLLFASSAAYLMIRAFDLSSRYMTTAAAALLSLAVILFTRNTVAGFSAILGFHLTTESETLLHLHVSEVFELGLAAVIWLSARRASGSSERRIAPLLAS
jgi:hypothetical protein